MGGDLSSGKRCLTYEQLGPGPHQAIKFADNPNISNKKPGHTN